MAILHGKQGLLCDKMTCVRLMIFKSTTTYCEPEMSSFQRLFLQFQHFI